MENKINIAELLKDCPQGMELDCTMYEDVCFDYVDELNIIHCYIQHEAHKTSITFNQHGTPNSDIKSKCVIFPKGKTTWEGFVPPCKFKDGDVLVHTQNDRFIMSIYKSNKNEQLINTHVILWDREEGLSVGMKLLLRCYTDNVRLATKEEKEKLFDAIKANGYKWNEETKTLEKLPKFKVGDRVRNKNYKDYIYDIHNITDRGYRAKEINADSPILILFGSQEDNYELVSNKFDITALKPFDKVLVRDSNEGMWSASIFSHTWENKYICIGVWYNQCIPYEGNEHLLGITNDCDDFYKTWE